MEALQGLPRTLPDRYSVRHMEKFTRSLSGKSISSTTDFVHTYNRIQVNTDDIPKPAITTPFGLFEFPFMSFGLRSASQIFKHFMDGVSQGYTYF